jgi:hypothetical protein
LRNTSIACESAAARHLLARRRAVRFLLEKHVRVHLDEERRAALQIEAELDLARRVALKLVQDEQLGLSWSFA